jgi:hypothetical protein
VFFTVELTGLKARMEQAEVVNSALAAQVNHKFVVFALNMWNVSLLFSSRWMNS